MPEWESLAKRDSPREKETHIQMYLKCKLVKELSKVDVQGIVQLVKLCTCLSFHKGQCTCRQLVFDEMGMAFLSLLQFLSMVIEGMDEPKLLPCPGLYSHLICRMGSHTYYIHRQRGHSWTLFNLKMWKLVLLCLLVLVGDFITQ